MVGPRGAEGVPKKCQKPSRRIHPTQASTPAIANSTTTSPSPPVRMSASAIFISRPVGTATRSGVQAAVTTRAGVLARRRSSTPPDDGGDHKQRHGEPEHAEQEVFGRDHRHARRNGHQERRTGPRGRKLVCGPLNGGTSLRATLAASSANLRAISATSSASWSACAAYSRARCAPRRGRSPAAPQIPAVRAERS